MSESAGKLKKSILYIGGVIVFGIILYWLKIDMNSDIIMLFSLGTVIYADIQIDNYRNDSFKQAIPYMIIILLFVFMNISA